MKYLRALTIAGSDSGGGAGIQADLKAFAANGCFGMSAITAITAQNTQGVRDIHAIPVTTLTAQIEAVLDDIGADAVKIGMLHSSEVIMAVKEALTKYHLTNVVLDPVMVATSGDKLLQDEAIETLKKELLPMARIITPNIPEAEILLGYSIPNQTMLPDAARELGNLYHTSVLLKAGHLTQNRLTDILYNREDDKITELVSERLNTPNTHGTGCTLSSALAAHLAHGTPLTEATRAAKDYINNAIIHGSEYTIGHGHGPVHHFYKFWK